jgi:hypothetical protein
MPAIPSIVIAGLDPAIHVGWRTASAMDARIKSAHDECVRVGTAETREDSP